MRLFLRRTGWTSLAPWRPIRRGSPLWKQLLLAVLFFLLFQASDGSAAASHAWEGAPPTYWPVGFSLALLLFGGISYAPLILASALVAALANYHRPLWSWCGIPGVTALYACYFLAISLLRGRLRIDPKLTRLQDVGRYVTVLLLAEAASSFAGMMTLWGDGLITRSQRATAMIDWFASDAIALLTFSPFLLVYVAPQLECWLKSDRGSPPPVIQGALCRREYGELFVQGLSIALAIWVIFDFTPAIPYQPLYLLFIPVIWVAVRRGLPGAVLTTFLINVGLTSAAWLTQAPRGTLPRLQFAMLVLGLTGLFLGAVVSEGKRAAEELRQSEAGLHEAQRVARLGSWKFDPRTEDVTWTEELYQMFGLDPALPPPRFSAHDKILTSASWQRLQTEFLKTMRTGVPYELELEIVRRDGSTGWILARGQPQRNAKGLITGMCGIAQDITERKLAENRIRYLAYYDALTGLPNRSLFQDRLAKSIATARRRSDALAVFFLDLDRFKIINDSLGHSTGDLLLQEVADRLKHHTRDQDTVARVGGDEFLIVLNAISDVADAAKAAERIINALSDAFLIQGRSLKISCSLGISVFPDHGGDGETLIKNADSAMYGAKDSGRNRFRFFTEEMNVQVLERSSLEQGLRMALDRKELFLMYQPQVDIHSGKTTGLEALLRWRTPELGLVPPNKFIRVAENSGLIIPIGEWALQTACSQIRQWRNQGLLACAVAVNVSAMQFRQDGFRELIHRVLRTSGVAPQYLELELTESVLTTNADVMFSLLQDLKDMGLKLAIDDFGTGYSSLSYLRQFPVSKLKIDRSFIHDVAASPDAAAIATAVISLAKGLNLKVIAEGVETSAQLEFLRAHDCDEAQGYYFSEPLLAEQVPDYLRRNAKPNASGAAVSMGPVPLPYNRED